MPYHAEKLLLQGSQTSAETAAVFRFLIALVWLMTAEPDCSVEHEHGMQQPNRLVVLRAAPTTVCRLVRASFNHDA